MLAQSKRSQRHRVQLPIRRWRNHCLPDDGQGAWEPTWNGPRATSTPVQPGDVTYSFNRAQSIKILDQWLLRGRNLRHHPRPHSAAILRIATSRLQMAHRLHDQTKSVLVWIAIEWVILTQKAGGAEGRNLISLRSLDTGKQSMEKSAVIRDMTIKYFLKKKRTSQYEGKPQQRWALSGLSRYNEQRGCWMLGGWRNHINPNQ